MGQKINFIITPEIASGATGGIVLGDFNNWNESDAIKLKVQKDGSLKASTVLDPGKAYQYRYLLNDGRWVNDTNASYYYHDPVFNVENCVVQVDEKKKRSPKSETILTSKSDTKEKTLKTDAVKAKKLKQNPSKQSKAKKESDSGKDSNKKITKRNSKKD